MLKVIAQKRSELMISETSGIVVPFLEHSKEFRTNEELRYLFIEDVSNKHISLCLLEFEYITIDGPIKAVPSL